MKNLFILATLLATQALWAESDSRSITVADMTDLSTRAARELKACKRRANSELFA